MRIRMKADVSGSRNGQPWPGRGQTLEVSDAEGADLCAAGIAAPVAADEDDDVETATAPDDDVEKRTALTTQTAPAVTPGVANEGVKQAAPRRPPAKKTTAKKAAAPAKPQTDSK